MIELKPARIIRTAVYFFLTGLFFFFVAANVIFGSNGVSNFVILLLVVAAIVLVSVLITVVELKPAPIILISFYCFLVGLFLLSAAVNAIFGDSGTPGSVLWPLVVAAFVFAAALVALGTGILNYNQLCWKILLFVLIIFISNVVSLFLVGLVFLWPDTAFSNKYSQCIHIAPITWVSFLSIFLSGIIVLYYHTRKEIVSYFGDMGNLLEPF